MPSSGTTNQSEVRLQVGKFEVTAATEYGPRLVGLTWENSPNLLARLDPEVRIDDPDTGVFVFQGGHRLWAAPEIASVSYAPDDHPCEVRVAEDNLTVTGPTDAAGLVKTLIVRPIGDRLEVTHRLSRIGPGPIELAPWAITQLPLGGIAIMPIRGADGSHPRQAHRSLVLWPYTQLEDPRLTVESEQAMVEAVAGPPLKIGTGPAPRRLGYLRDGYLFVKEFSSHGEEAHVDLGAVGQVFTNQDFCELESLGPFVSLDPGSEISHQETWSVLSCDHLEAAVDHVGSATG